MTRTHRRKSQDVFFDQLDRTPDDAALRQDRERVMDELAIRQDGTTYLYNGYRYGRLGDAVDYARLIRSREPAGGELEMPVGPFSSIHAPQGPSDEERVLMSSLTIFYVQGQYRFENYRYDRLDDAVSYARLAQRRATQEPPIKSRLGGILFRPARLDQ
ncbi:hypothetical protein [Caldimonas sp. KR1-144]|uniref:hypothetical protein n=1 Tax=Caldimonas sp. KR1-144 TaxID=3400911 RepID=UPI003BFFB9F3